MSDETQVIMSTPEGGEEKAQIPSKLPVLPVRDMVLYPYMYGPLMVQSPKSIKLIDDVVAGDRLLAVVAQRDPSTEDPGPDDLYRVGCAALVLRMLKIPDGTVRLLVQGLSRVALKAFPQTTPYLKAAVEVIEEVMINSTELQALSQNISTQFQRVVSLMPQLPDDLQVAVMNVDPGRIADLVAFVLPRASVAEKQGLLEEPNVQTRLGNLTVLLNRELEVLELSGKIQNQVQSQMGEAQRRYFLEQQLKQIQQELGQQDERTVEINELRERIEKAGMPEEARKEAERELDRLSKMPPAAAEYTVARTYIDWLLDLPWSVFTEDNLDITQARQVLDEDHYDLEKIKDRIIEYLAVRRLKADMRGPILCFVGPPGTGKTSLGQSIARALGRKFVRLSLGGVRDEAEIRGHRRTYIGALPGRIIQGIKKAGSNNPVFMLDEVDKIGADFRGDPSAALLEVLDPEQNFSFSDHYIDVPFDLSKVMFITTANLLAPIPPALQDRMEVLALSGYTTEEKVMIAKEHLIPRQLEAHGLKPEQATFEEGAIETIIRDYTREAGLRNLEREIGSVCRKVAKEVAEGKEAGETVTANLVHEYLGPIRFFSEVAERTADPGVATGLAWTQAGGDILFIEATKMPGQKGLILTGQLGDVMKESAQAALSYVRSRAGELGIPEDFFQKYDLHIHIPAGQVPKDGPSAGVTLATALTSLLTEHPVRPDLAMTGEITLRGKVLPVGGIKEKMLAARRAGIKTVLLPKRNEKDLVEIPDNIKRDLEFKFVERVDEVLKLALGDSRAPKKTPARKTPAKKSK